MKPRITHGIWLTILFLSSATYGADEGMFPISELDNLDLASRGFRLKANEIFNPDGIALVDGICRVNGCTGSFVSDRGLIITNHHCAFEAIQNASSKDNDLLTNGFSAKTFKDEIPAPGYTVRITEGYRDVSADVLAAVTPDMPHLARTKAIEKRAKELEQAAEVEHPGLRAEVAEMFAGKVYMLFLYTYLKDIRLVFAPPSAIGNFGGEVDNWEWPRHTGDFSFLRAYVGPDGKPADFAANNMPYTPKRFIQVAPGGVDEGDFVFLLGYPGRTVRHKTASFLRFEQNVRLPLVVDLYGWQMSELEKAGASDRAVAIKHASRIKSLANVEKRSRGQLLGLRRIDFVSARAAQESQLQQFIEADPARRQKYGQVLEDLNRAYDEITQAAPLDMHLQQLRSACRSLGFAFLLYDSASERAKPNLERESPYMDRNWDQTVQQLKLDVKDWDGPTDEAMLAGMLARLAKINGASSVEPLQLWLADPTTLSANAKSLIAGTKLGDPAFIEQCLTKSPTELAALDDPVMKLAVALYPTFLSMRQTDKTREGRLNQLYGDLVAVKQQWLSAQFVPDANGTLRLTYGHVRGYSPTDAIIKAPISTLKGVIDKTTGVDPFITPAAVIDRFKAAQFGPFKHPQLNQVPVAILYSTDTTGGNSGSPVLNAQGQLVGVNFDRTFEATINDFAWNESYSRSIGVDIRYVLWITGIAYDAEHLLAEMGVSLK